MPTYEYECDACQHQFEEFQNLSDEPLTKCPKCKKNKLERLFGGGGAIIFKGAGFYETDYRRAGEQGTGDAAPADAKPEAPAASTEAPKPETKSESKPAGGGSKKKEK